MLIQKESEILDQGVRARIISEINAPENKARKDRYYMQYQVYKDRAYDYVIQKMLALFDRSTVMEMSYAISNVSLCRKVIDKLARVYSHGVKRVAVEKEGKQNDDLTNQVEELSKLLSMNQRMKKTNRSYKRDKNCMAYVKPLKYSEGDTELFDLEVCVLYPYLYDVIEFPDDREKAMCVIMSHYKPPSLDAVSPIQNEQQAGIHGRNVVQFGPPGNQKDEKIADTPQDQDAEKNQYIWWSKNYHFTTNEKGEMLNEDPANPILEMPFINFTEDQDGSFWAQGGEDLINGSVLVNSLISHMNHIAVTQGYGQFYMTGKDLPKGIKIGPSKGIRIEVENKEDPTPQLGFLSANPPLDQLKNNIEMYVALLLTTNNLSVRGIATQTGDGESPASGIALIIDKSESMEDVKDQEQIFIDQEPKLWRLIAKWLNLFKSRGVNAPRFEPFNLPEDLNVLLKFPDAQPIVSEKEKLEVLQLRKDMGLNTMAELLMKDDPSLTEEQALERLTKIAEEKAENMAKNAKEMIDAGQGSGEPGDPEKDDQPNPAGPDGNSKEPADPSKD